MKKLFILLIRTYQWITQTRPQVCRFYPSCSTYSKEAIEKYGILKGVFRGIKRVLKCHPFHPGGYDPVEKIDADIRN